MTARGRDLQDEQSRACAEASDVGRTFRLSGHVAFVVNSDRAFVTHRAPWGSALQSAGAHVTVFAPDTGYRKAIERLGFDFVELDLGRENISPIKAARAAMILITWVLRTKPAAVFLIQTAAYTLGWLAAPLARRTRFVRVAGGIGRALSEEASAASTKIARALIALGKLPANVFTLFQIDSDRNYFLANNLARTERSMVLPGTGIDTNVWTPATRIANSAGIPATVAFVSRLYAEKGVREFVEAARALRGNRARFVLVGEPDEGVSSSIAKEEIDAWREQGLIEYWGHRDDMLNVYQQLDLLVFPSRHPEGTPRTLIEAAACGVPAIVSNQPGCQAVVIDEVTGWVLKEATEVEIAAAVEAALSAPELLKSASAAARKRAVREFGLERVIRGVLNLAGARSLTKGASVTGSLGRDASTEER